MWGGRVQEEGPARRARMRGGAHHVHALLGDRAPVVLEHLEHVLIVAPRHRQVLEPAALLVDASGRVVPRVVEVGVLLELVREDDLLGELAAHRERVAHDSPLRLAPQREHLADVVQEAHEVHPVLIRVRCADALGRLEVVDRVGQRRVGVGVIDERVEELDRLPDRHLALVELEPPRVPPLHKVHRLADVHLQVRALDERLALRVRVVAELLVGLDLGSDAARLHLDELVRRVDVVGIDHAHGS